MLETGSIATQSGRRVSYAVDHYEVPSHFGIDGGRISKLWLCVEGVTVVNYDRGWDIRAEWAPEDVQEVYRTLLRRWN